MWNKVGEEWAPMLRDVAGVCFCSPSPPSLKAENLSIPMQLVRLLFFFAHCKGHFSCPRSSLFWCLSFFPSPWDSKGCCLDPEGIGRLSTRNSSLSLMIFWSLTLPALIGTVACFSSGEETHKHYVSCKLFELVTLTFLEFLQLDSN